MSDHNGEPFNIGSEKPEISMKDLAKKCIRISEKENLKIRFRQNQDKDYTTDNPNRRCPDITKAKDLLGFSPLIGLDDGIRRTLNSIQVKID